MLFRQLYDSTSSTLTYLLADSSQAILIDPVFEQFDRDQALVRELGLQLLATIDTHVHADHVTSAWLFREKLGARTIVGRASGVESADRLVAEGDTIEFGARHLDVLETPGHTEGCTSFVLDDASMVFTGDTLLIRGAGRTDFQGGDAQRMFRSIRTKLFALPRDCLIYPGHDYMGRTSSSVGEERDHNPRVGDARNEGDFLGYMRNLNLPHPKKLEIAVPANLMSGRPENGQLPNQVSWGPVHPTYSGIVEIEPEWVVGHIDELTILDVRTPDEVETQGKIEGSVLIPIDELDRRSDDIPEGKPIVVVCRSGARSAQATVILTKQGYQDVANLAGGMLRWKDMVT